MTDYDIDWIRCEVARLLDPADSNTEQGRRLETFVGALLGPIPSVEITGKNALDASHTQEIDIWVAHEPAMSRLPFAEWMFPVECKNEKRPVKAKHIREFATKIRRRGCHDGLLISTTSLTGSSGTHAHQEIEFALAERVRITVVRAEDLLRVATTDDLIELIRTRNADLRRYGGFPDMWKRSPVSKRRKWGGTTGSR